MKTIKKISKDQLVDMLMNWKFGAQPASIQYLTTPEINKFGLEKYGIVFKLASIGCMLGYIYSNSINNELKKQKIDQNFLSLPLWKGQGQRLNPLLAKHISNGKLYISYKYQQTFKSYYFDQNLNRLNENDIKLCLKNSKSNNNNNFKPVIEHRELSIDNIKKMKFKKITYIIG